jgi:hypothetical protein
MSAFEKIQDRIARIIWEKCDSSNDQQERGPWREAKWMELASKVIKEVLAEVDSLEKTIVGKVFRVNADWITVSVAGKGVGLSRVLASGVSVSHDDGSPASVGDLQRGDSVVLRGDPVETITLTKAQVKP